MPSMNWSLGDTGLGDDPQAGLLQQLPLLLSLLWTVPPFNANFQGAKEVSRPPLVEDSTTNACITPGMTNVSSQRGGYLDGRSKNPPSSLVGKPS